MDDKKISELETLSPVADDDLVVVVDISDKTMSVDGTTKKALKSELKGVPGDAATVDAGTTTTLAAGESATVTNVGTTSAAVFNFAIPQGIQGLTGADGACVESVAFVGNDMVFTLDDASTVTLTNAKTTLKGDTGLTGAKIVSASFVGDDLVFVLDDASTVTVTGAKTTLKGDTGLTGETGATGKGITSITKTGTVGLVDTYTITYTDATTTTFNVTNGEDGADGTGSGDISGSGVANELAYFTAEKTIDNLPVTTYPSLTEVSYIKGLTSAIQTQLNAKAPSANPTFTGTVILPKTIEIQDTSADHQYVLAVNELTADRTVTLPLLTGNDEFTFNAHTQTLTNKRLTERVTAITSHATPTVNTDNCNFVDITALAEAITNMSTNLSGTPTNKQKLIFEIKDNGTARAIAWGTSFVAGGVDLPTTTVANKILTVGFMYSTANALNKWRCIASAQEA